MDSKYTKFESDGVILGWLLCQGPIQDGAESLKDYFSLPSIPEKKFKGFLMKEFPLAWRDISNLAWTEEKADEPDVYAYIYPEKVHEYTSNIVAEFETMKALGIFLLNNEEGFTAAIDNIYDTYAYGKHRDMVTIDHCPFASWNEYAGAVYKIVEKYGSTTDLDIVADLKKFAGEDDKKIEVATSKEGNLKQDVKSFKEPTTFRELGWTVAWPLMLKPIVNGDYNLKGYFPFEGDEEMLKAFGSYMEETFAGLYAACGGYTAKWDTIVGPDGYGPMVLFILGYFLMSDDGKLDGTINELEKFIKESEDTGEGYTTSTDFLKDEYFWAEWPSVTYNSWEDFKKNVEFIKQLRKDAGSFPKGEAIIPYIIKKYKLKDDITEIPQEEGHVRSVSDDKVIKTVINQKYMKKDTSNPIKIETYFDVTKFLTVLMDLCKPYIDQETKKLFVHEAYEKEYHIERWFGKGENGKPAYFKKAIGTAIAKQDPKLKQFFKDLFADVNLKGLTFDLTDEMIVFDGFAALVLSLSVKNKQPGEKCKAYFFMFHDGKKWRCYVPVYGNGINVETKRPIVYTQEFTQQKAVDPVDKRYVDEQFKGHEVPWNISLKVCTNEFMNHIKPYQVFAY